MKKYLLFLPIVLLPGLYLAQVTTPPQNIDKGKQEAIQQTVHSDFLRQTSVEKLDAKVLPKRKAESFSSEKYGRKGKASKEIKNSEPTKASVSNELGKPSLILIKQGNPDLIKGENTEKPIKGAARAEYNSYLPSSNTNTGTNKNGPATNALPSRGVIFTGENFNFQFPPLTSSATISAWGAGGAGGGVDNSNGKKAGGGGGGGAFAQSVITVGNGTIYSGVAGVGGNGTGPDSNWNSNAILAKGGTAGGQGSTSTDGTGGAGGSATASIGTTRFSGGNGAAGSRSSNYSGGGGGSAGQGGAGGDASGITGGAAGTGTPAGAAGANGRTTGGPGTNGTVPGSGGSGAYRNNGTNTPAGGNGADGQVLINYDGYCRPLSSSSATYINNLSTTNGVVNISKTATGYGPYGYQNFYYDPNGTVSAPAGGTFDLSFTLVGGTAGVAIWIDWNQDGVFDTTERILTSNGYLTSGIYNVTNISVPVAQTTGDYVMRIVTDYWSSNPDSCNLSNSGPRGEGEDYKLTVLAAVSCNPITATADKYSVCSGDTVTLSASSTSTGYTYTWYTDWNNDTHTGTLVGTGASIVVNPTISTLYGVVATKAGCPTGVNAAYALIIIAITPPPTLVVLDPVDAVTCSNEVQKISVVSGGIIPQTILNETWDPLANPWITSTSVIGGAGATYAAWGLAADNYRGIRSPDHSNFAVVDSDYYGPYQMESSLISPPLSFTDYNTPINLEYDHYFQQYSSASTAYVEITTDGINWTTLTTYTTTQGGATSFAHVTTNLNAYVGQPFVQIRFRYNANNGWYWAVDNIKVTGTNPKATTITWSPATGLWMDAAKTIPYTNQNTGTVYASPTNTTVYTAAAKTAVGCPANTTVTVERGDKQWLSTSSTDWNTATNWIENKVPTEKHCVIIQNTGKKPIITINTAKAKNLTVDAGAGLTIKSGGALTVTDFIKNNATADDVVLEDGGNLLQINDAAANTGSMTAQKTFTLSTGHKEYNYVISPVVGQNLSSIYPGVQKVLYHNEAINNFGVSTGNYIAGRALAVKEPATGNSVTGNFKGGIFNGTLSYPLAYTTGGTGVLHGYNLVGNPYPSNLDVKTLYTDNSTKMEATFYFWDNRGNTIHYQMGSAYTQNQYAFYNASSNIGTSAPNATTARIPTRYVKVGTGFMIRALSTANGSTLNYKNAYRSNDNTGPGYFGKKADAEADRYWITLTTPQNLNIMNGITYFEGGNNGFASDDTQTLGSSDDMYSIVEGEHLTINGKAPFVDTDAIQLGTNAFESGIYKISLYDKEGVFANGQKIYLKDKQTGILTELTAGDYSFAATAGTTENRFEIWYRPEGTLGTQTAVKSGIEVYKDGQDFVVRTGGERIEQVELYDASGRLLYQVTPQSKEVRIDSTKLANGVYVLKIGQKSATVVKKVIK